MITSIEEYQKATSKEIIKDFLDFVKIKPPKELFSYVDPGNCAFAQYLKFRGICEDPGVGPCAWDDVDQANPSEVSFDIPKPLIGLLIDSDENWGSLYRGLEKLV